MWNSIKKRRVQYIQKNNYPKHLKILREVPEKGNILDVGCGDGRLTKIILKKNKEVKGCDIEEPNGKEGFNYFILDLDSEFKINEKFEVVIFSDVLEHLKNPKNVLEKFAKISKRMIISLPNNDFLLYKLFPSIENPSHEYSPHLHHWNVESFKKIIPKEFSVQKIEFCSDFPEIRFLNYLCPKSKKFNQTMIFYLKKNV